MLKKSVILLVYHFCEILVSVIRVLRFQIKRYWDRRHNNEVNYILMKKAVFWDVAPYERCVNRRFEGTYRLHLHGRREKKKIRERGTTVIRCRRYVPPKRRLTQDIHCATSQKTALFIVTAVKTSDLTYVLMR
jgi:hypothetical protein